MHDDKCPKTERLAESPWLVLSFNVDLVDIAHSGRVD